MGTGLGIDIGAEHIKIVQAKVSASGVTVTGALKIPRKAANLPDMPEDVSGSLFVPETLGMDLKKAGLRRNGTLGISGREVILKYLSTPPAPPEKLRMFIDIEIGGKLTGSSGADNSGVTYDFRMLEIPSGLRGDLVVMAGVCKNEYIYGVSAALKAAQMAADRITPSCFGLVQAYLRTQTVVPNETVVLIDVGHELLEVAILEEGRLYFARSAPGGGKKFTNALDKVLNLGPLKTTAFKHERARIYPEGAQIQSKQELMFQSALREGAESIAGAIRSSMMFCRTQAKLPKLEYQRVILSGGGARLNGLREYLEKKLGRPVQTLDLYKKLDLRRLDAASARCFEGETPDMTVALGLAIIDADPSCFHFSLIPEKVLRKRAFWTKTVYGIAAGAVLLASVIPPIQNSRRALAVADEKVAFFKERCDDAVAQKKKFAQAVKDNQALARRTDYYARQTRMGRLYLKLFGTIRAEMPAGIMLSTMGPASEVPLQAMAGGAANAGVNLGAWPPDENVKSYIIRGYYEAAAFPEVKLNQAWDMLRSKLLAVPGVRQASIELVPEEENATKAGMKVFQAKIFLQDENEPLKTADAVKSAPKPAPPAKKTR